MSWPEWDSLINSLVYGHLLQVSPGLAEEFREQVNCSQTEHELEHFVDVLEKSYQTIVIAENNYEELPIMGNRMSNVKIAPPSIKQNVGLITDIANKSRDSLGRFNPQEDEVILTEGSVSKDWGKLATLLGRKKACVQQRYERLKTDVGGMKRYTPTDDCAILDEILDRVDGRLLSEASLPVKVWRKVAARLRKDWHGVVTRWRLTLLPWLLQHKAGTLNMRIEVMLATHLLETYVWTDVASRPEFAGHNAYSLKNQTFNGLKFNAATKFGISKSELSLLKVVEYSKDVYGEGRKIRKDVLESQRLLIEYFEQIVLVLKIENIF